MYFILIFFLPFGVLTLNNDSGWENWYYMSTNLDPCLNLRVFGGIVVIWSGVKTSLIGYKYLHLFIYSVVY